MCFSFSFFPFFVKSVVEASSDSDALKSELDKESESASVFVKKGLLLLSFFYRKGGSEGARICYSFVEKEGL